MTNKMKTEKYRVETGTVFEYCSEENAYFAVGKLNGRTLAQFIRELEIESDAIYNY